MTDFVGLTWDHPRGRHALEATSDRLQGGDTLRWEVQPLEGFESAPIAHLAARYDLLVIDHPHLGDALKAGCLTALDRFFTAEQVSTWQQATVGPSLEAYRCAGRLWALPLDAATQVSARDPRLVPTPPATWRDAVELADDGLVATNLAGPHAFLSLCAVAVSLGDAPGATAQHSFDPQRLFHPKHGADALDLLTRLSANAPHGTAELNPIGLLDRMRDAGDIGYIPLVYGYVTHSTPTLVFDAPPLGPAGIGSTLGGTGIAITGRTAPSQALIEHLRWLMDPHTQATFIPAHDGQPSAADAWNDAQVDAAASGFYSRTRATLEAAWIRPRLAGYVAFQTRASAVVRDAVHGRCTRAAALQRMEQDFAAVRSAVLDQEYA